MINDETINKIRAVFDQIRPAVATHGGNLEFVKFEDGFVHVKLEGACVGCPSSFYTLTFGLETALKEQVPQVLGIVPTSD
jgi:Fe-S cluster biogenesis protein NfuA